MTCRPSRSSILANNPSRIAPLGADSLLWRLGFPRTSVLLAGRALLLQVAHPTVGAGVRDFSRFQSDPWGRFDRTVTSLLTQLFGGPAADAEARRLRARHHHIAGTGFDGRPYQATEPEAWAWVHLTNADTMLAFYERWGPSLDPDEQERYWADWRQAGLGLGLRPGDLPGDVEALHARVEEMAAVTLGDNETVRLVLQTLALEDVPPPRRYFPRPVWNRLRPIGRSLLVDTTIGTLPSNLRARLGLAWTADQQRRLDHTAALVRAASVGVPDRVLHYPPAYRAMRAARAELDPARPW
jgi:uncharacterized protein (DUF2236 family)